MADDELGFAEQVRLVYEGDWCSAGENSDARIDAVSVDQWWVARIRCIHGMYSGVSDTLLDLGIAFERARGQAVLEHAEPAVGLISVTEAAEILGVTRQAVMSRIGSGSLRAVKVGATYVIQLKDVEKK